MENERRPHFPSDGYMCYVRLCDSGRETNLPQLRKGMGNTQTWTKSKAKEN